MSVILFAREDVYQTMADAFEHLKHVLPYRSWDDEKFYKALRRIYFSNVATFLCQYHDDTPLPPKELAAIDPFMELQGKQNHTRSPLQSAHAFLVAWGSLKYNLVTNDGEQYEAKESREFLDDLALVFAREVLERETREEVT